MNRQKIIAVDFDGCLAIDRYPNIGLPIFETMRALKIEISMGSRIILWTCRRDNPLRQAVEWCRKHGIEFEAVNENLPEIIKMFGGNSRKIFANEYWDDRARRMPSAGGSYIPGGKKND
jgi:hypothetical protein